MNLRYFKLEEFDSPDLPGSGEEMKGSTLSMLDRARAIAKIPFVINSGYRTKAHNEAVGGKEDSAHPKGYAADIKCLTSRDRQIIVSALLKVGFTRIGIGKNFIHVDSDPSKPQNVIWLYD